MAYVTLFLYDDAESQVISNSFILISQQLTSESRKLSLNEEVGGSPSDPKNSNCSVQGKQDVTPTESPKSSMIPKGLKT
jgi:hypothetical protein